MAGSGAQVRLRNPQESQRYDERHGAEIKKPLHNVDRDLRTQRLSGFFRDQIRPDGIGEASDQRHSCEPNDLGS